MNNTKPKPRVNSEKPTIETMKQKLTIKIKNAKFKQKRNSNTNKACSNLDDILDFMKLEISEKNSEKVRVIQKEEEIYEKDIKALKKRLLFEQSNWKLLDSEIKFDFRPKLHNYEGKNFMLFRIAIDNQKELDSESEYSDQQYDRNTEYIRTDREGNIGNFR